MDKHIKIISIIDNIIFWTFGIWIIILASPILLCLILYKWSKAPNFDKSIFYSSKEIYEPDVEGYSVSKNGVTEIYKTDNGIIKIHIDKIKSSFIKFLDEHKILNITRDNLSRDYKWRMPHDVIVDEVRYPVATVGLPQSGRSMTTFRQDKIIIHPYKESRVVIEDFKQYQYVECRLSWTLIEFTFDKMKELVQDFLLWDTGIYKLYKLLWSDFRRNWSWCLINNGILNRFKELRICVDNCDMNQLNEDTIVWCDQLTSKDKNILGEVFDKLSLRWAQETPSKISKWFTVNEMLKLNCGG